MALRKSLRFFLFLGLGIFPAAACGPYSDGGSPSNTHEGLSIPGDTDSADADANSPAADSTDCPSEPPKVDYSCTVDEDCAIKNVGNCCGADLYCVNKDSTTDPEGVLIYCSCNAFASICMVNLPASCACVNGSCVGN